MNGKRKTIVTVELPAWRRRLNPSSSKLRVKLNRRPENVCISGEKYAWGRGGRRGKVFAKAVRYCAKKDSRYFHKVFCISPEEEVFHKVTKKPHSSGMFHHNSNSSGHNIKTIMTSGPLTTSLVTTVLQRTVNNSPTVTANCSNLAKYDSESANLNLLLFFHVMPKYLWCTFKLE